MHERVYLALRGSPQSAVGSLGAVFGGASEAFSMFTQGVAVPGPTPALAGDVNASVLGQDGPVAPAFLQAPLQNIDRDIECLRDLGR